MSEKRHKIKKFANYQNIIVRNSPPSTAMFSFLLKTRPLICGFWRNAHDQYTNPLARPLLIALQVVRTSFGFHLRECMGSSLSPLQISKDAQWRPWSGYLDPKTSLLPDAVWSHVFIYQLFISRSIFGGIRNFCTHPTNLWRKALSAIWNHDKGSVSTGIASWFKLKFISKKYFERLLTSGGWKLGYLFNSLGFGLRIDGLVKVHRYNANTTTFKICFLMSVFTCGNQVNRDCGLGLTSRPS